MNSQNEWTVERFFIEKPIQLELFLRINEFISSLGKVKIKATKSQILFAGKRQFAWIWMPMEWDKKRPPNSIVLSFSLGEHIKDSQIAQAVETYPGRWMHHVIIKTETDFNVTVKRWLKDAYDFGK